MNPGNRKVIEAILLLADEPVPAGTLAEVVERPRAEIVSLLGALAQDYEAQERGFVLREVAGGWRLYTSPDCAPWLERFVRARVHGRLSGAALEVLAIVAYRGPLARAEITDIRGVDSDGVVKTLVQRGLLESSYPGGSGPTMFSVSRHFLEAMGVNDVSELPTLTQFMPDAEAVEEMESRLSPGA